MRHLQTSLLMVAIELCFLSTAAAQRTGLDNDRQRLADRQGDLKAANDRTSRPVQHANGRSDVLTEQSAVRPAAFQSGYSASGDSFGHSAQPGGQYYPEPAPYGMNSGTSDNAGGYSQLFGGTAEPLYSAYGAVQGKAGNNRVLGDIQLMVPLWQDSDTLFFADMRGQMDDHDSSEGNWGLGLRSIMDTGWILGAYGFYDHRETTFDHHVQQATFGMEALAVEWEARVNGYVSEGLAGRVAAFNTAEIANGTMVLRLGQERAYSGVDAEVGALITDWNDGAIELRGFAGGFHFSTDAPGFREISGPRVRMELRSYDLAMLGEGSRVTLGTEYSWDQIRDDQIFAVAHVRIPLGPGSSRQLSRLERRMLDRIVRDVDIVSHATSGDAEQAINPLTGEAFGRVETVDASSDLQAAIASAGVDGTIIASGDAGQLESDSTITLLDGQTLFGGGSTFEVEGATSGSTVVFTAQGSAPVFHQSDTSVNVISLSNDNSITGTTIQGGRDGIHIGDATGFRITNNTLSDNARNGINVEATGSNQISGRIENNVIRNAGTIGTLPGTASGAGIHVSARDQADVNLSDGIIGNNFDSAALDGVVVTAAGDSSVRVRIQDNTSSSAGGTGIVFDTSDASEMYATVVDNTIAGSVDSGVRLTGRGDSHLIVAVSGNQIDGNDGTTADGIRLAAEDNALVGAEISGNAIDNVAGRGIFSRAGGNSTISLINGLTDNTISGAATDVASEGSVWITKTLTTFELTDVETVFQE